MPRTTPHVEQDTLTVGAPGAEQIIAVDTPAWFSWLETATLFTFASPDGTFTARRERASSGRGGWYWRAEQRRAGGRRRADLGATAELTLERLHAVAASLASAVAPIRRGAGGDPAPVDGVPAPPALPTGTATFLFTDIEGSTQLWEQHPQAMRTALARHDTLLRQAIGAHGGGVQDRRRQRLCRLRPRARRARGGRGGAAGVAAGSLGPACPAARAYGAAQWHGRAARRRLRASSRSSRHSTGSR